MLVAVVSGGRVIAERGLDRRLDFRCPACGRRVILKAGSVVIAHFAHETRANCIAEGESRRHLAAKKLLRDQLASLDFDVTPEVMLSAVRRADLLVADEDGKRFTIEIQDSSISVDEMKARERADKAAGCFATCWVFTDNRLPDDFWELRSDGQATEARLPNEMRYRWHATHRPVLVLRLSDSRLVGLRLTPVDRPGEQWFDSEGTPQSSSDSTLRATFGVEVEELTFMPYGVADRYRRLQISFEPERSAA
jgi:hypothetical protein